MTRFDIAIHGAGFVGQALALALARQGFAVALIGKATPAPTLTSEYTDIRAFALGCAAKTLLEDLGAWPDAHHATPVVAMDVYGDKGGHLQFGEGEKPLNWIVDVPALAATLKAQVTQEPRITRLAADEPLEATVHAHCEGKRTDNHTIHYPQYAIAARLDCELPHGNIARQWFSDTGDVLALLPLHSQQVALVWSLATEDAKRMAQIDTTILIDSLEAACGKALGAMRLVSERALWPLSLTKPSVWTKDNWVLAGDAAHTVHPLAGQGLNLGLGDAALLAQTLTALKSASPLFNPTPTQLGRGLRRYARARQAVASQIQLATDGLHLLFARQGILIQGIRNNGMNAVNRMKLLKTLLTEQAQ